MYVTEAMLLSMEDMKKNSQDMETHIKGMIETEARMHGLELDARRNARDLWHELNKHLANMPAPEMHVHPDGTEHAHEGGEMPHTHGPDGEMIADEGDMVMEIVEEPATVPVGSRGSGAYLPDRAAQAAGMAPPTEIEIEEPAAMPDDGVMETEDDTDSNGKS